MAQRRVTVFVFIKTDSELRDFVWENAFDRGFSAAWSFSHKGTMAQRRVSVFVFIETDSELRAFV
jgi:hypothetical protein